MRRLAVFVCSFGYVGFFPVAPGTAGSAAGVALWWLMQRVNASAFAAQWELLLIVGLFAAGVWLGASAERALGSIDPGPVVIDEVMGMLLTLALVPVNWLGVLAGFVIFRALDIKKPYPAGRLEHLPGGLGMMADDAMAALYGNVLLRVACYFVPALVT
jgi:phosphatidylglycerophosphatase A